MKQSLGNSEFTKWLAPLLDALRALGGRAKRRDCSNWIAEQLNLPPEITEVRTKTGVERFHNQVQWARQYLVWEGLIDPSERGFWKLTPKGFNTHLEHDDFRQILLKRSKIQAKAAKEVVPTKNQSAPDAGELFAIPKEIEEQQELLEVLQSLSAAGFEQICKRLLSEFGLEKVKVSGRSHDGGIDGDGILRLNPFVAMKCMFQCKKVSRGVSRSQVGDFRNAVMGRADKGIFLTTGWFTLDAEREAKRDGVLQIELVDGECLVELFESKQLGLRRREIFEVDHNFFEQFR